MRTTLALLLALALGVGCMAPEPVFLPAPSPVPAPAPTPSPTPTPTPPVADPGAWADAEAFVVRVQAGEVVTVAEIKSRFGEPARAYTRPDDREVMTWRVLDAAGANVLNVHAVVDPATGRVVEVNPR